MQGTRITRDAGTKYPLYQPNLQAARLAFSDTATEARCSAGLSGRRNVLIDEKESGSRFDGVEATVV
jgi:hypothetical protein